MAPSLSSCSLLIRKDLRDLFEQLAISYRSMAVNTPSPKVNGVKGKTDTVKKLQKLGKSPIPHFTFHFTYNIYYT